MSLVWKGISVILFIEIVVLTALCAPLPWGVRKNMSRWIVRINARKQLNTIIRYIWFGLMIALIETISSLRSINQQMSQPSNSNVSSSISQHTIDQHPLPLRKAKAERNLYLAAFGMAALFAISRLVHLATIEIQLRKKIKEYNGNKPITEFGDTVSI